MKTAGYRYWEHVVQRLVRLQTSSGCEIEVPAHYLHLAATVVSLRQQVGRGTILLWDKAVFVLAVLGGFRGAGEKKSLMLFFCGFIAGNNIGCGCLTVGVVVQVAGSVTRFGSRRAKTDSE